MTATFGDQASCNEGRKSRWGRGEFGGRREAGAVSARSGFGRVRFPGWPVRARRVGPEGRFSAPVAAARSCRRSGRQQRGAVETQMQGSQAAVAGCTPEGSRRKPSR